MDIFIILFIVCLSFLIGIIVTLVVQYYILYTYFEKSPAAVDCQKHHHSEDYGLPEALKKALETEDFKDETNKSSLPISLVLQFLFYELRHSESLKRWLYKKLSMEFDELLNKTTIGKFFDTITIKDMELGSQFPDIKNIKVEDAKLNKKGDYIDTVSLSLNLDYTGNFLLGIHAKMKFGKTTYLSIKVKKVSGVARLQFTRNPYTHWSFSFCNEPVLDLAVESNFQGRQLQSNITNLIVNQIKRAIRRKHTLPNYKIRYKPFFVKTDPSQLELEDNEIIPSGQLEVTCVEVTRVELGGNVQNVYCTMSVDSLPWISIYSVEDKLTMVLEITITKMRQTQLGIIFRQDQAAVIVESVSPNSCASRAGLKPNDVVLAVENKPVTSIPQTAKYIKSISSTSITLRVERLTDTHTLHNIRRIQQKEGDEDNNSDDVVDLVQTEQDNFIVVDNVAKKSKMRSIEKKIFPNNENVSKLAQTIGSFSLRKRKTSISDSNKNLSSSVPGTPQHNVNLLVKQSPNLSAKKLSLSEMSVQSNESSQSEVTDGDFIDIYRTRELPTNDNLFFNDDFQFNLKSGMKYLNVNVWGVNNDNKDILLGYVNIPLSHILNECCQCVLGNYMKTYSFLPPTMANQTHPLMSHSGFEHVFCYGDVLMSFVWSHQDDDNVEMKRRQSSPVVFDDGGGSGRANELPALMKHDFIRTQFHQTTHCDFCSKKIWLKDAVQCRECGLCCHKKCVVKCQLSTGCISSEHPKSDQSESSIQPEIRMTEFHSYDDIGDRSNDDTNLKRVNSVNNLAIPGLHTPSMASKSLPQSPQRTPSRKQSLLNINPFMLCPMALEDVQKEATVVDRLLEQVMLCPADESLMDVAKETGKQLYVNMAHEERVEKVNIMMGELKKTLDLVTVEHIDLSKRMNSGQISEEEKAKVAFLMGQADAKVHGLSVLMLHYCSSLQHTQEKIV